MEQPKLLDFDEKKTDVKEEKPEVKEEKAEEKKEVNPETKEEKETPNVKLIEENKEQNKEEKTQINEQKPESKKEEGKEIKIDKKALIEGIKYKMDEEAKQMEESILKKIKGCKNVSEKIQLALINERMTKRKELDKELEKEIEEVTKKFEKMAEPLYSQMNAIINGEKAIEENDIVGLDFITEEDKKILKENEKKGVEQYWFKVLINCEEIAKDIKKKDEEALKSLKRMECVKDEGSDSFSLLFEFEENEFFKACTLKKSFEMKDQDTATSTKCDGKIEWKEGKNLTVKIQKKNKKTGKTRTISKEVPDESFFNFFNDAEANEGSEAGDEEEDGVLTLNDQLDIALYLADETIPYSLEYYLGVKKDDCDCDSCNDDDDDDDDESDEDDKMPKRKKSGGMKKKSEDDIDKKNKNKKQQQHKKSGEVKKETEEKPECKQQ